MTCMIAVNDQCNPGVLNAYAYWRIDYKGNIPSNVPDNGPDTLFLVYLKINKTIQPGWIHAMKGNQKYKVIATKVSSPVEVGVLKGDKNPTFLSASENEQLWQLTLEKSNATQLIDKFLTPAENEILLIGKSQEKPIYQTIKTIRELEPVLVM